MSQTLTRRTEIQTVHGLRVISGRKIFHKMRPVQTECEQIYNLQLERWRKR